MSLTDDLKAAAAGVIGSDQVLIAALGSVSSHLADVSKQLADLLASGLDPVAVQSVIDDLNAEKAKADAAVAAVTPPAPPTA